MYMYNYTTCYGVDEIPTLSDRFKQIWFKTLTVPLITQHFLLV